jgi:hypothetical protein
MLKKILLLPATLIAISFNINIVSAQPKNQPKNQLYSPIPLTQFTEITDTLSIKDIPTGQGGFARDYTIKWQKGDNIAIDLSSENFDTIITVLSPDGSTLAENDDGPDGSSNSLLFTRIVETGTYIVRVRSFGETGVGTFKLKVTKLSPVK